MTDIQNGWSVGGGAVRVGARVFNLWAVRCAALGSLALSAVLVRCGEGDPKRSTVVIVQDEDDGPDGGPDDSGTAFDETTDAGADAALPEVSEIPTGTDNPDPLPTQDVVAADAGVDYVNPDGVDAGLASVWLDEQGCPHGGSLATAPTAVALACQEPLVIDLTEEGIDDIVAVSIAASQFVPQVPPQGSCGTLGSYAVVAVALPLGLDLEFSVDGTEAQDWVLMVNDVAAGASPSGPAAACSADGFVQCIDGRQLAGCEWLRLANGTDFAEGVVSLVLGGRGDSRTAATLRLRLSAIAGSGS